MNGVAFARGGEAGFHEVLDARIVALPSGVTQLDDVFAVVFVNLLADGTPKGNLVVVVDHGVVRLNTSFNMDRNKGGNVCANARARDFFFPIDAGLAAGAVVVFEPPRDTRTKESVLHCQISKLQRLENDRIIHASSPSVVYARNDGKIDTRRDD